MDGIGRGNQSRYEHMMAGYRLVNEKDWKVCVEVRASTVTHSLLDLRTGKGLG